MEEDFTVLCEFNARDKCYKRIWMPYMCICALVVDYGDFVEICGALLTRYDTTQGERIDR